MYQEPQRELERQIEREIERNGGRRIVEEDDSNTTRDGGEQGTDTVQRPMRSSTHPAQQMQAERAVPSLEMRGRAPRVREVRVRACDGENVADAEDPSTARRETQVTEGAEARDSSHSFYRQRVIRFGSRKQAADI